MKKGDTVYNHHYGYGIIEAVSQDMYKVAFGEGLKKDYWGHEKYVLGKIHWMRKEPCECTKRNMI